LKIFQYIYGRMKVSNFNTFQFKCIILFLIFISLNIFSQNFSYKKFTTSDGLMSNQIENIFIDSKGMLWIGNGNGITRFKGKTFSNYVNDSIIAPISTTSSFRISELNDGNIYYSIKYGFAKTSKKKKHYLDIYLSDTLSLKDEEGVIDKNGIHYFKSGYIQLDVKNNKVISHHHSTYPDGYSFPSNLLVSNHGNVFYSFYNKDKDVRTLFLYSNNEFRKVCDDITFIMAGIFESERYYFIIPEDFNQSNPIILINKNNLTKTFIFKNKELPNITLLGNGAIFNDNFFFPSLEGFLIISLSKKQTFVKDEFTEKVKNKDERFYESLYSPVYFYSNYLINGYRLLNLVNFNVYIPDGLKEEIKSENFIRKAIPDKEGNIWYATYNGLFQLFQLPYVFVFNITEDRIAEINELIEKNRFKCVQKFDGIDYCLNNDSENIQILIPEVKDKFYKFSLSTKSISPIYVEGIQSPILKERLYPLMSYKKLIICQEYTRGLVIYRLNNSLDTAYYNLFSYSNGLLSNYVENVFVDKNENIWIITWDGIQVIGYQDLLNNNYDKAIRYSQSFKLDMIPYKIKDDIYFADGTKLYKISTSQKIFNNTPPEIIIETISYTKDKKTNELIFKQDSTYILPYNFDELKIDFFGVCLSDGFKVKYKYIIDNKEHYLNEGNIVINDLSVGTHTLVIYAANKFNVWTPIPKKIYFEIPPPIWERWWFRVISLIVILGIIILIVNKREYVLKKRQVELENLVSIRTKELSEQNQLIEQKKSEILDSIHYTERLQKSSIPSENELKKIFPKSFILYQPKDIISGDFYFSNLIKTNNGEILHSICVGDCTGHGVPGAFMSILVLAYIKQSMNEKDVNSPADALEFISKKIQKVLEYNNQQDEVKDSADMVFAVINNKTNTLWCVCANNPVYLVRNNELIEIPAQKRTVGYSDNMEPFINQTFELKRGDMIYLFSDGYSDQFGGLNKNSKSNQKDKKFTKKRFKQTLLNISKLPIEQQKEMLLKIHLEWKGNVDQTDDICIVGIEYV